LIPFILIVSRPTLFHEVHGLYNLALHSKFHRMSRTAEPGQPPLQSQLADTAFQPVGIFLYFLTRLLKIRFVSFNHLGIKPVACGVEPQKREKLRCKQITPPQTKGSVSPPEVQVHLFFFLKAKHVVAEEPG